MRFLLKRKAAYPFADRRQGCVSVFRPYLSLSRICLKPRRGADESQAQVRTSTQSSISGAGRRSDDLGAGAKLAPENKTDDFRLFDDLYFRRIARFASTLGAFDHFQFGAGGDLVVPVEETARFRGEE